jgi:hypothetical protein
MTLRCAAPPNYCFTVSTLCANDCAQTRDVPAAAVDAVRAAVATWLTVAAAAAAPFALNRIVLNRVRNKA